MLLDPPLKSRAAPLAKSETQRLSYVPAPSLRLGPWARARGPGPRYRGAPGCPALQHPRPEQARPQQARPQRGSNVRRSVYPRDAPIVRMRRRTFEPRCYVLPYQNPLVPDDSGSWIATPRLVTPGRLRLCGVQTRGFAETQLDVTQKSTQKSDCVRSSVQRRPRSTRSRERVHARRPVQGRYCALDRPSGHVRATFKARSRPVRGRSGPLDPGTPRPAGVYEARSRPLDPDTPDLQWRPLATSSGCASGSGGRGNPRRLAAWWIRSRVLSRTRPGCR